MASQIVNSPIIAQYSTGTVPWTIDGTYTAHVDLSGPQISYILRFQVTFTPVPGATLFINSAIGGITLKNNGSGITSVTVRTTGPFSAALTGGNQSSYATGTVKSVSGDTATIYFEVDIVGDTFYATSITTVGTASINIDYSFESFNGQMLANF